MKVGDLVKITSGSLAGKVCEIVNIYTNSSGDTQIQVRSQGECFYIEKEAVKKLPIQYKEVGERRMDQNFKTTISMRWVNLYGYDLHGNWGITQSILVIPKTFKNHKDEMIPAMEYETNSIARIAVVMNINGGISFVCVGKVLHGSKFDSMDAAKEAIISFLEN